MTLFVRFYRFVWQIVKLPVSFINRELFSVFYKQITLFFRITHSVFVSNKDVLAVYVTLFAGLTVPIATAVIAYFQWKAADRQSDIADAMKKIELNKNTPYFDIKNKSEDDEKIKFDVALMEGYARYTKFVIKFNGGFVKIDTGDEMNGFISCQWHDTNFNPIDSKIPDVDKIVASISISKQDINIKNQIFASDLGNNGVRVRRIAPVSIENLRLDIVAHYYDITGNISNIEIISTIPTGFKYEHCPYAIRTNDDSKEQMSKHWQDLQMKKLKLNPDKK